MKNITSPLSNLLNTLANHSQTEREKGTYFETLIISYLTTDPFYKELYEEVLTFSQWVAKYHSEDTRKIDTGINLVAKSSDCYYN